MLAVHPSLPVKTTKEFIALAKARPGQILYCTAGMGAFQHLATSVFANMAGINMTHVPFKGGAPAVVALVGGEVQAMLTVIAEVYPHIQSGRLRPIAVSSDKRTTQFPNIPTIAETVKGYDSHHGLARLPGGHAEADHRQLSARSRKRWRIPRSPRSFRRRCSIRPTRRPRSSPAPEAEFRQDEGRREAVGRQIE
jgi:tripartite-type tricarboxylate transporter receptor subunit TctC